MLLRTKQHFPHLNTRRQSGQSSLRPSTRQRQKAPEDKRLKPRDHAYLLRGSEPRDITPTTSGLSAPSLLPGNCTFVKIVESNISFWNLYIFFFFSILMTLVKDKIKPDGFEKSVAVEKRSR